MTTNLQVTLYICDSQSEFASSSWWTPKVATSSCLTNLQATSELYQPQSFKQQFKKYLSNDYFV